MIYNNILDMIGDTPTIKLNKVVEYDENIYVKLERYNPGGSVKDRAVIGMIEKAEIENKINKERILIEASSGNTGIALAMIGCLKGYKVVIVMPESMSIERRDIIKAYGAELILTDAKLGMSGAIQKMNEIVKNNDSYVILGQFENDANPKKHYETTAREIINDIPDIDIFVAGVGTGGTLSGVAKYLKEINPNIKIVAVEPEKSAVLSGKDKGVHKIQGIGAGFIPDNYYEKLVDEIITVSDENALDTMRKIIREEGVSIGISSGANIYAAMIIAKNNKNKKIVTIAPDSVEKYLSMKLF